MRSPSVFQFLMATTKVKEVWFPYEKVLEGIFGAGYYTLLKVLRILTPQIIKSIEYEAS